MLKGHNKKLVLGAGFQSRTRTGSVILNPNTNNTGITENVSPAKITGISIATSSALIPVFTIPLQVPKKTSRGNSSIKNDRNTSEKFTSQDNPSGRNSSQFQIQNTKTLPLSQSNITQTNIPMYNPFTA